MCSGSKPDFFLPGLARGAPKGLFQAALGMSSFAWSNGENARRSSRMANPVTFFRGDMQPPSRNQGGMGRRSNSSRVLENVSTISILCKGARPGDCLIDCSGLLPSELQGRQGAVFTESGNQTERAGHHYSTPTGREPTHA